MKAAFWHNLKPGFLVLAPMEAVSDSVFRQMVKTEVPLVSKSIEDKPDVMFSEFTHVDGICHFWNDEILKKDLQFFKTNPVGQRLFFTEGERPLVAQIWGTKSENYFQAAGIIADLGFDGIDINLGCPKTDVIKQGAGAGMIMDNKAQDSLSLVKEIVKATKAGARGLPLSIKTRIGLRKVVTEEWISFLLSLGIDALTIHLRTASEGSKCDAHWEEMGKIVKIRNDMGIKTKIIGNGDVKNAAQARELCDKWGNDGVMIARGVLEDITAFCKHEVDLSISQRCRLYMKHLQNWEETWHDPKNFAVMKKFAKSYIKGFDGAADIRWKFMEAQTLDELIKVVESVIKSY